LEIEMRGNSMLGARILRSTVLLVTLTGSLALAACSDVDDAMFGPGGSSDASAFPTDQGDQADQAGAPAAAPQAPMGQAAMPGTLPAPAGGGASYGGGLTTPITPVSIEPGSDTGTAVGHQVAQLRGQVAGLNDQISSNAQQLSSLLDTAAQSSTAYHDSKSRIMSKLQMGTTRGNPELVGEWNTAQAALDQLTGNINALNALGTAITNESSQAHFALNTIMATFNVSGAVDEDHRQLSVLEDETNQTIILVDRLLKEVSDNIQRQTAYVANERANLTTLADSIKNGELYGGDSGLPMGPSNGPISGTFGTPIAGTPLVVVKFDRPDVQYQQILYTALAQALQSRPSASFEVVAATPTRGTAAAVQLSQTQANRHAQQVMRSMTDMGVPSTRLAVASATDPSISNPEVRVYIR
jgi:hypothetical protein